MSGECQRCHEHCLDCKCNKTSRMKKLKDIGLIGCLNDSEITSENCKQVLRNSLYLNATELTEILSALDLVENELGISNYSLCEKIKYHLKETI